MRVVGIDQSLTHTAVVVLEDGDLVGCHVIKSNKKDSIEQRIAYVWEMIDMIIDDDDLVYLEGLSYGSNSISARPLAGLYYHILVNLNNGGYIYDNFPPKTIKKFALNGNAKKPEMFAEIPESDRNILIDTGYKKTTGLMDLSDAYWIARYGEQHKEVK